MTALTDVEITVLRILAEPNVDWISGKAYDEGIRRLEERGYVEGRGRKFGTDEPAVRSLTKRPEEILAAHGVRL